MSDDKIQLLINTVHKLYQRKAISNIKRVYEKSHKADIAAVIESFKDKEDILNLFKLSGSSTDQAEILSFLGEKTQAILIRSFEKDKVLELLSHMESDDVADLLGQLEDEEANLYLQDMNKNDSEELTDLMGYPEDSAGGIMSSDFLAFPLSMTVEDVIKKIQDEEESENSIAFYIYVINDENQLVGVVSLKQLLLSKKSFPLKSLMTKEVISVGLETDQEQVARLVERYDFLALPVVSNSNELMGVITVDDILDVIREEAEEDLLKMGQAGDLDATLWENIKARAPWLGLSYFGGGVCFLIIYWMGHGAVVLNDKGLNLWLFAAFTPLLLSLGGTVGSQIATKVVSLLKSSGVDRGKVKSVIRRDFYSTLIFALLFAFLTFLLGLFQANEPTTWLVLSLALFSHLMIVVALGATLPVLAQRIGMDSITASVPVYIMLTDIMGVFILFLTMNLVF